MIQKDRNFLIDLARKYYINGLSQQELARHFGISRPSVSNLLKQCREEGIVEIRIQESDSSLVTALAERIKKDFGLRSVVVVPSQDDSSSTLTLAGSAAAELLQTRLLDRQVVGLSWGSSLYQVVKALNSQSVVDVEVLQMAGSLGMENPSYDGFELSRNLARKLNGNCHLIQAPVIVKNLELKKLLLQEPLISETMAYMDKIDVALVGMSSDAPEHSSMVRDGFIDISDARKIRDLGGIGHICALHYDRQGVLLDIPENQRVVGISWDDLIKIPEVIGVACGSEKSEAILGAIKGGLINSLITDENAALRILSQAE